MKRMALLFATVPMFAFAQSAERVKFEVQNFTRDDHFAVLTIAVTNQGNVPLKSALMECGFLNKTDKALDVGKAIATNLAVGQTAYVQAIVNARSDITKAECRVSEVRPQ
jgi:hypothetical protein